MATTVTLSSKNQIVVPREAREKLHIGPGDELLVLAKEDRAVLTSRPSIICRFPVHLRVRGEHRKTGSPGISLRQTPVTRPALHRPIEVQTR